MLLSKTLGDLVMSTKKTSKKTIKNNTKNDSKNDPKNTERQTPVDDRDLAKSDHVADNKTVLCTSKIIPTDIKKTPNDDDNSIIYHVCQCQYPDDKTIIQKMCRVDKMPTHAVLVRYADYKKIGAAAPHHVLIWTRSEKLANAHRRRVLKQYCEPNPTIELRYLPEIFIVSVRDLGMSTSTDLDPNFVEDRTWERAKNAARRLALAATSPAAVSAAAVALNDAVLKNYLS
jgi:hypothetical protein